MVNMRTFFVLSLLLGSAVAHLRGRRKLRIPHDRSDIISEQYIVVFDKTVDDVDSKVASLMGEIPGSSVLFTYKTGWRGFALQKVTDALLGRLLDDPQVLFVEPVRLQPRPCANRWILKPTYF